MIPLEWVQEASQRLAGHIINTPVTFEKSLNTYFKWENRQKTGSFKLRGALNKVLSLQNWELLKGLVTCSAGNHGQGVAYAAKLTGSDCVVFASEHATQVKLEAMKLLGAGVHLVHGGYEEAERAAIEFGRASGRTFVSPYNDGQVIAGQGTVAAEIVNNESIIGEIKTLVVPVGGGGLVSGIGVVLAALDSKPRLIGVQSESSAYTHQLFHTGTQAGVTESASIADGLSGEIAQDSVTIPMMQKYMDDMLLVKDSEIREAIKYAWGKCNEKIEGSAAVGLAAILTGKIQTLPALAVMTGGNIQPELFQEIISN